MFTRVSYATVGLFVILLGAAIVAAGLWFSVDLSGRDYQRYSIYSTDPVTGLSENASVRYQGVVVGEVREINLDQRHPGRVHLLVDIAADTPLRRDTRARITVQGVTGIAHIELTGGSPDAPPPAKPEGEPYPVIETTPSLMARLDNALGEGLATLDRISAQMEKLLQDDHLESLGGALANMEALTSSLLDQSGRLDSVLGNANTLFEDGIQLSGELRNQLPTIMDRLENTLSGVDEMTMSLSEAGQEVAAATREGSEGLQDLTRGTLPQLNSLMRELEILASDMGALAEEISDNPSLLIYGRPRRPPGPGE